MTTVGGRGRNCCGWSVALSRPHTLAQKESDSLPVWLVSNFPDPSGAGYPTGQLLLLAQDLQPSRKAPSWRKPYSSLHDVSPSLPSWGLASPLPSPLFICKLSHQGGSVDPLGESPQQCTEGWGNNHPIPKAPPQASNYTNSQHQIPLVGNHQAASLLLPLCPQALPEDCPGPEGSAPNSHPPFQAAQLL